MYDPGSRFTNLALDCTLSYTSDRSADPAIGLTAGLKYLPIFLAIGAACFFAGSFFYTKDLARVERVVLEPEK